MVKEKGEYLTVRVPEGCNEFDLCIPYHNNLVCWKGNGKWKEAEFIEVKQIKPNTGIKYKIIGLISDLAKKIYLRTDLHPDAYHLIDKEGISIREWGRWLIIKVN